MKLKYAPLSILILATLICGSCSGGDNSSTNNPSKIAAKKTSSSQFEIRVSKGNSFNNNSKRAKVHMAYDDTWGFKASGWYFRIAANKLPDDGSGKSEDLGYNNTLLTMKVDISGKKVEVSCKPAKSPEGIVNRTQFDGKTVSGSFKVKFETCTNYMSGEAVAFPKEAFWVEGEFNNLTVK